MGFSYAGRFQHEDEWTLADYNIKKESTLTFRPRLFSELGYDPQYEVEVVGDNGGEDDFHVNEEEKEKEDGMQEGLGNSRKRKRKTNKPSQKTRASEC